MTDQYWHIVYDGDGLVHFGQLGPVNRLRFGPAKVLKETETKAALLTLKKVPPETKGIEVQFRVIKQLRELPRPWEVFWLFFGYASDIKNRGSKRTDYFILKTNGIEIGRAFGSTDQVFVFTKNEPKLVIGQKYLMVMTFDHSRAEFRINNMVVARAPEDFLISELFLGSKDEPQTYGLYSEDAEVEVESVRLLH